MAFIELTDQYGNKIMINITNICIITPSRNGSALILVNNEEVLVKEELSKISEILKGA